ncbi:MAG: hypothetical protein FJX46_08840 [Alphaproteobacteria bacterium]|nr:hypothetical protein [Alphaproteobacteria bacterium]
MSGKRLRKVERMVRDGDAIDRAMVAARRKAILRHRQLGVPLVLWRDGRVIEIDPNRVPLPRAPAKPRATR